MPELLKMTVAGQFKDRSGQRLNVVILRIAGDGTIEDLVAFSRGGRFYAQADNLGHFLPGPAPHTQESNQVSTAYPVEAGPSSSWKRIRLGNPRNSTPGEMPFDWENGK